ncbi:MAG: hypothetical protein ACQERR_03585 [Pseudomonadota bacterium]
MFKVMSRGGLATMLAFGMLVSATGVAAEDQLRPFVLASVEQGTVEEHLEATRTALVDAEFEIVGEYSPHDQAHILAITSQGLREAAARSDAGAYAAAHRVGITETEDGVQVSYTNPRYLAHAYRLIGDLGSVSKQLAETLGREREFGSEKGLSPDELAGYRYMFGMPRFDDPWELAEHDSHEAAVAAVEAGLEAGAGDTAQVYRIDIPRRNQVLFGVALGPDVDVGGDARVMDSIDFGELKHTPHLPYEVLVDGNEVKALAAKFRIAMNFPDLSMMGGNSFMSIRAAPGDIEEALEAVANYAD